MIIGWDETAQTVYNGYVWGFFWLNFNEKDSFVNLWGQVGEEWCVPLNCEAVQAVHSCDIPSPLDAFHQLGRQDPFAVQHLTSTVYSVKLNCNGFCPICPKWHRVRRWHDFHSSAKEENSTVYVVLPGHTLLRTPTCRHKGAVGFFLSQLPVVDLARVSLGKGFSSAKETCCVTFGALK